MQPLKAIFRYISKNPLKNPLYKYIIYMKNKKSIIDTYYLEIYDVYLVVANKYTTLEELKKLYVYSDGVELTDEILKGQCTTSTCYRKEDNTCAVLVKYNTEGTHTSKNRKTDFINTCGHEGTHVALDIYEMISQNVCFCTPEPFCYLVGWATECIYKTLVK